jgi:hypothetical protein
MAHLKGEKQQNFQTRAKPNLLCDRGDKKRCRKLETSRGQMPGNAIRRSRLDSRIPFLSPGVQGLQNQPLVTTHDHLIMNMFPAFYLLNI